MKCKSRLCALLLCAALLAGCGPARAAATPSPTEPTPLPVEEAVPTFSDVGEDHWAAPYIGRLAELRAVSGLDGDRFEPDRPATRAEVTKFLFTVFGVEAGEMKTPFPDVPADFWGAPYVGWAVENGLVNGFPDGSFRPNESMTRVQLAAILWRAFQRWELPTGTDAPYIIFTDQNDVLPYAQQPVAQLARLGVLNGYEDNTFRPDRGVTRAEVSKLICQLLDRIETE